MAKRDFATYGRRYVPRKPEDFDFELGRPFIADDNYYVNQLDLSGIVPSGALAVIFTINVAGVGGRLDLTANNSDMIYCKISVVSGDGESTHILNLDLTANDRKVDALCFAGTTGIRMRVQGYFI